MYSAQRRGGCRSWRTTGSVLQHYGPTGTIQGLVSSKPERQPLDRQAPNATSSRDITESGQDAGPPQP